MLPRRFLLPGEVVFEASSALTGPLAGLKVIALTQVLSGPFATMWLATMGAEVIKIENPKSPDEA